MAFINEPLGSSNCNEGNFVDSFIPKSIPPTLNTIEPKYFGIVPKALKYFVIFSLSSLVSFTE
jgi:hypothetical protein